MRKRSTQNSTTTFVPVYIFSGVNEPAKEQVVQEIVTRVLGTTISEFNYNCFYADATQLRDVIDTANTAPFGSPHRVIVLKRIEAYSAKDRQRLAEYAQNPSSFTCLIVCYSNKPPKTERWYKDLVDASEEKVFWPYNQRQLVAEITKACAVWKKNIEPAAAQYFAQRVGDSLVTVAEEAQKICDYCGTRTTITAQDVHAVMTDSTTHNMYEWAMRITDGKYKEALHLFQTFSPKELSAPQYILYILADRYIKIVRYRILLSEGTPATTAQKMLGVIPFLDPSFHATTQRYDTPFLSTIFNELVAADRALKTGKHTPELVMEKLLISIARADQARK